MVSKEWITEFEEKASELMEKNKVPGGIFALAKSGEVFYEKSFGYTNLEKKSEPSIDTVFGIGSITKSFSCMAIMHLQEKGMLSINDPVSKYLPEFRFGSETDQITIHHFMSHTSGLPPLSGLFGALKSTIKQDPNNDDFSYPFNSGNLSKYESIDSYEDLLAYIEKENVEPLGKAGTQFSYSNDAFALLGAIIERASGETYESYVKEHILKPIGMKNTTFFIDELGSYEDITTLYTKKIKDDKPEVFAAPYWWDAPAQRAAGFLKSTARDMLRYTEIFRNGGRVDEKQIISEESVKQMISPHIQIDLYNSYGYGLVVSPSPNYRGHSLIEHTGGIKGVSSQMFIAPEMGITGILLMNMDGVLDLREFLSMSLNGLNDRPLNTIEFAYEPVNLAPDVLNEYIGRYESSEGVAISIEVEEGNVFLITDGVESKIPLQAVKKDYFITPMGKTTTMPANFIRDNNGCVCHILFGYRQLAKVKSVN